MSTLRFAIPITVRSANVKLRQHWAKQYSIAEQEHSDTFKAAMAGGVRLWLRSHVSPFEVTMTRVIPPGGKTMDDDNLSISMKAIRDEVARILGVNDSMASPVEWRYQQSRGSGAGVTVEIHGAVL